jgi:Protein of unknown function (DUF3577)
MSTSKSSNYIDLQTSGIGYLSRIRTVTVRKGKPFVACSINAMHGEKGTDEGITYVPFDVKAVNAEVEGVLRTLETAANSKDKVVMVRFRVGDFYPDSYTIAGGDRAGEMRIVLKGRLLFITHAWVKTKGDAEMQLVYERPRAAAPVENGEQQQQS